MSLSFRDGVLAQPENLREAAAGMREALAATDLEPLRSGTSCSAASARAGTPCSRRCGCCAARAAVRSPSRRRNSTASRDLADSYVLISQSGASTEVLDALDALGNAPRLRARRPPREPAGGRRARLAAAQQPARHAGLDALLHRLPAGARNARGGDRRPARAGSSGHRSRTSRRSRSQRHGAGAELLAAQLAAAATVDVVAAAPALASAGEAALLGREALHLPAAHEETRQYLHGPLEPVGEGFACLLFGAARELELGGALAGYGAAACVVTAEQGPAPFGAHVIRIAPCDELAAPILQIVPVQLAVAHAAAMLGLEVRELSRQQPDTKIAPA